MLYGSPFIVPSLVTFCCCCCGPEDGRPSPFSVLEQFDDGEVEAVRDAWLRFIRGDPGRTCGDFFKTLQPGVGFDPDPALAGRGTLLTKVGDLIGLSELFASNTFCVRSTEPPPVAGPPPIRRPIEFTPERIVVEGFNLDPFGTPRFLAFQGTTGEYFFWKNNLPVITRAGLRYIARRSSDGTLFDEFCNGPACA